MSILALVIAILILLVLLWAVRSLCAAFGVGDPIATVLQVVVVVVGLLWILQGTLGHASFPMLR